MMWPRWRGWRGSRNTVSLWVFQFSFSTFSPREDDSDEEEEEGRRGGADRRRAKLQEGVQEGKSC